MMFQKKFDRARKLQRQQRGLDDPERMRHREQEDMKLERGDFFAMIVSSFFMIFLPAIFVLCGILFFAMWLFGVL